MPGSWGEEFVRRRRSEGLLVGDVDAGGKIDVGWFRRHVAVRDRLVGMEWLFLSS